MLVSVVCRVPSWNLSFTPSSKHVWCSFAASHCIICVLNVSFTNPTMNPVRKPRVGFGADTTITHNLTDSLRSIVD